MFEPIRFNGPPVMNQSSADILRQPAEIAPAVQAFVAAVNDGSLPDVINAFLSDAIVNDQLVEYEGHHAIGVWARNDLLAQRTRMSVIRCRTRPTGVVLTVEMTGDFDGLGLPEPLVLSCYFSLSDRKIDQLIILRKDL
ncbi:hypothetical protein PZN02_004471 [Sinorhizobium garamanticum]|uniref:SnoaL-like domain-containing protein n=1 Tax=Sinorhizobium garamanticum TaxID=680247 RepID=A0ABY8DL26_9HYPH|nr:hypothetical protein [Sinorhizobium garamanticum]WEX90893.1 hypothetical protein PZN02_004471 [Sinorhizobium garamanticum]